MKHAYSQILLGIVFLFGGLSGCTASQSEPLTMTSTPEIQLVWEHLPDLPKRTSYEIGEVIWYLLGITNHTSSPLDPKLIECRYFFTFAEPLNLYLLSPNGRNLLEPYCNLEINTDCGKPTQIVSGKYKGYFLTFTRWVRPRQLGTYRLWAEYIGSDGVLYASNVITFEVRAVPATVSPALLDVQLAFDSPVYSPEAHEKRQVFPIVTFTNHADRPLTFLKPQEGSLGNLINPIYQFTALDQAGRGLGTHPPDTQIGTPIYNTETMFTLQPDASYSIPVRFTYFPEMVQQPGAYQVQLTYIVRPNAIKWGMVLDEPMNWDENVFTGVLESNVVTLTVK